MRMRGTAQQLDACLPYDRWTGSSADQMLTCLAPAMSAGGWGTPGWPGGGLCKAWGLLPAAVSWSWAPCMTSARLGKAAPAPSCPLVTCAFTG